TNDSSMSYWLYAGAMREDLSKKIFFITSINEYLYYDFGLNKNDTFRTSLDGCLVEMIADSVDSVMLLNGEYRKRIFFQWGDTWIDGIGSMNGVAQVAFDRCTTDAYAGLNCFTEDQVLKYKNPIYPSCYFRTTGIKE